MLMKVVALLAALSRAQVIVNYNNSYDCNVNCLAKGFDFCASGSTTGGLSLSASGQCCLNSNTATG